MKSATNRLTGRSYSSVGPPCCWIRPSRMTTMTSLIVSASSWSWVTYTNVIPTSRWRALSSSCISLRSLRSRAPSGSSRSSTVGSVDERPGERDALLLAAGHLPRPASLVAAEADELERLADAARLLGLVDLPLAQAVADVLGDVHVREQRVVLEDRVDVAPVRRHAGDRLARRGGSRPRSAARSRRSSAASSSCRSPTGRGGCRTRRARCAGSSGRRRRRRRSASSRRGSRRRGSTPSAVSRRRPGATSRRRAASVVCGVTETVNGGPRAIGR